MGGRLLACGGVHRSLMVAARFGRPSTATRVSDPSRDGNGAVNATIEIGTVR
jgi:hypothetical protein